MGKRLLRASFALGLGMLPSSEANFENPIQYQDPVESRATEEMPTDQAKVLQHMGQTALEPTIMSENTKQEIYPDSLVVELEYTNDCAVEYVFSEDIDGSSVVSVGIFGRPADMTDLNKVNGPEMYDGTFGHGDTDAADTNGIPTSTIAINTPTSIVEYMEDKTISVCRSFDEHMSDADSVFPD